MAAKNGNHNRKIAAQGAETAPPLRAEWRVEHITGTEHIPSSSMHRGADGGYTFRDDLGVVADLPAGTVKGVFRKEAAGSGEDHGAAEAGKPGRVK